MTFIQFFIYFSISQFIFEAIATIIRQMLFNRKKQALETMINNGTVLLVSNDKKDIPDTNNGGSNTWN